MNWLERLNAASENQRPSGGVSPLHWAYAPHLHDNAAHRHTYFEACLVGRWGSGVFRVEDREIEIGAGDFFVARPGVIHQIRNTAAPEMELFWVAFDVRCDSSNDETSALWRAFAEAEPVAARDDGQIFALWNALRAVAQGAVAQGEELAGKSTQLIALREALLIAIAHIGAGKEAPLAPLPARDGNGVARLAARYLHDNLGRKISVEEVAAHVHLSPRQLHRVFLRFAGVGVAAYLETARLDRARHLLHATQRPIKDIAASLGYDDIHYFTRVFSRRSGASPGHFRRTGREVVRKVHKNGDLV